MAGDGSGASPCLISSATGSAARYTRAAWTGEGARPHMGLA